MVFSYLPQKSLCIAAIYTYYRECMPNKTITQSIEQLGRYFGFKVDFKPHICSLSPP